MPPERLPEEERHLDPERVYREERVQVPELPCSERAARAATAHRQSSACPEARPTVGHEAPQPEGQRVAGEFPAGPLVGEERSAPIPEEDPKGWQGWGSSQRAWSPLYTASFE